MQISYDKSSPATALMAGHLTEAAYSRTLSKRNRIVLPIPTVRWHSYIKEYNIYKHYWDAIYRLKKLFQAAFCSVSTWSKSASSSSGIGGLHKQQEDNGFHPDTPLLSLSFSFIKGANYRYIGNIYIVV